MEFYSATKTSEILSFSGKWMELDSSILNEVSQAQKAKAACSLSFNLVQMQQYYEIMATLRRGHL
jgi:hypothetical protein